MADLRVEGTIEGRAGEVLTPQAMEFVAGLHGEFETSRRDLLAKRRDRQAALDAGDTPDFPVATKAVRESMWTVPAAPADLRDRRVEITGPVDRKMMINALNSGASVFMADLEDSTSPTWANVVEGQANLIDAVRRTIALTDSTGKRYRLHDQTATLMVRPRGWHLAERHVSVGGEPVAAALFDFGLYTFHNAREALERGTGPYLYLPKLEGRLEARLWNEAFRYAEDALDIPRGSIRATVLIETILAAFEMDEILHELAEHASGLNAGRWDYIFSMIKKFRLRPEFVLPDRAQVTMAVPFMRTYADLLVRTCHRRGAHAIGGMAAFIPNRRDPEVTAAALEKVRDDKVRESGQGFDGTWVAHPDLVQVAAGVFDHALGDRANQLDVDRDDVTASRDDLLDVRVPDGDVTEGGLRTNVSVGIQYLASWLRGVGAAAINNLMEDAATAEISRSQIWQWVRHGSSVAGGGPATAEAIRQIGAEELAAIRGASDAKAFAAGRFEEAWGLFEAVALSEDFPEFLTLAAYEHID